MRTLGITTANRTPAVAPPPNAIAGKPFFDDFAGASIDPLKWTVYNRLGDWGNSEINCIVPGDVAVSSGTLKITSKFEDHVCGDTIIAPATKNYTSGQVAQATQPFLYGTVSVRAKIAGGTGLWPCIWMLGYLWQPSQPYTANTPEHQWPRQGWCEIDIAEFMNNARTSVNCQIHYDPTSDGSATVHPGSSQALPFDATTRFMVYRFIWSAGSAIWQVDAEDGSGFRTLQTVTGSANVPNVPMYLVLHTAIGGIGGGTPNPATFPQTMEIDYAQIS